MVFGEPRSLSQSSVDAEDALLMTTSQLGTSEKKIHKVKIMGILELLAIQNRTVGPEAINVDWPAVAKAGRSTS